MAEPVDWAATGARGSGDPTVRWEVFDIRKGEQTALELIGEPLAFQTPFSLVEIVESVGYGRLLFMDKRLQSAEADEFIYHESLVHPALASHPNPKRVFIAGGAEGATAREALKHNTVESVWMVDIDEAAVKACMEQLPTMHAGAFSDPRLRLIYDDARKILEETDERFDVVIIDITDPTGGGPSYRLFTREFYEIVRDHLTPGGLISVQAESGDPLYLTAHAAVVKTLQSVFRKAQGYRVYVPSYREPWGLAVATVDGLHPIEVRPDEIDSRLRERGVWPLRFFDGTALRALFATDRFYRDRLAAAKTIITDDKPLIWSYDLQ